MVLKNKILVVTAEEHSDFFTQDLLLAWKERLEGKLAGLHIFSFSRYAIGPGQAGFILSVKTYI